MPYSIDEKETLEILEDISTIERLWILHPTSSSFVRDQLNKRVSSNDE